MCKRLRGRIAQGRYLADNWSIDIQNDNKRELKAYGVYINFIGIPYIQEYS